MQASASSALVTTRRVGWSFVAFVALTRGPRPAIARTNQQRLHLGFGFNFWGLGVSGGIAFPEVGSLQLARTRQPYSLLQAIVLVVNLPQEIVLDMLLRGGIHGCKHEGGHREPLHSLYHCEKDEHAEKTCETVLISLDYFL